MFFTSYPGFTFVYKEAGQKCVKFDIVKTLVYINILMIAIVYAFGAPVCYVRL